jgi:hypothetical protein
MAKAPKCPRLDYRGVLGPVEEERFRRTQTVVNDIACRVDDMAAAMPVPAPAPTANGAAAPETEPGVLKTKGLSSVTRPIVVLQEFGNIDLMTVAETAVYFIGAAIEIVGFILWAEAATGILTRPRIGIGMNTPGADNIIATLPLTGFLLQGDRWNFNLHGKMPETTVGNRIYFGVDQAATGGVGAMMKARLYIIGWRK